MDGLKNLIETLKERLKQAWAEQQESAAFQAVKERFDNLPPVGQKIVLVSLAVLAVIMVFWFPVATFVDSTDFYSQFEEKRKAIKELRKLVREINSSPSVAAAPAPSSLKTQIDQKLTAFAVKPEQIKDNHEIAASDYPAVDQKTLILTISNLTVRQMLDLGYELEHLSSGFKLTGLEAKAQTIDPHFYEVTFKVSSFSPKVSAVPGGGLMDAFKKKDNKPSDNKPKGEF